MGFWSVARELETERATLLISGPLDSAERWWSLEDDGAAPPDEFLEALNEVEGEELRVVIDSPGGNLDVGMGVYGALKSRKGKTTGVVYDYCASAATLILCGCGERLMGPNAMLMIHRPMCGGYMNADEMRMAAEWVERLEGQVARVYAETTGTDEKTALSQMDQELWLTSRTGMKLGYATGVIADTRAEGAIMRAACRQDTLNAVMQGREKLAREFRELRKREENDRRRLLAEWAAEGK